MLPSQQPMMLETALAFEHLIKNPKTAQTKKKKSQSQVGTHTRTCVTCLSQRLTTELVTSNLCILAIKI